MLVAMSWIIALPLPLRGLILTVPFLPSPLALLPVPVFLTVREQVRLVVRELLLFYVRRAVSTSGKSP